jgi:peptidoglycan/xylan/chitin deacetylase (PgdA/CDA1 family)
VKNAILNPTPLPFEAAPERPDLEWPGGARVAVYVELNLESWPPGARGLTLMPGGGSPLDPLNYGWRDYGARVGVWRVLEILDRQGIVASAAIDSDASAMYPELVEAGVERGWAWLAHGRNSSVLQGTLADRTEEEHYLAGMLDAIAAATGSTPRGWLGPALSETPCTIPLLAGLGMTHVLDWSNDDRPYPLRTGGRPMVAVPRSAELSDVTAFVLNGWSANDLADASIDAFDVLYEDGARSGTVFGVTVHPFLFGAPSRARALERLLGHVSSRSDVWLATSDEIADRALREAPASGPGAC